jgi:hypothetical protein
LKRWSLICVLALSASAETIDRIAVSIGSQVITESEVLRDLRVSAFLDHAEVDLSPAAKRKSAQRLVDQLLILREASESRLSLPNEEAVVPLMNQVRTEYKPSSELQATLRRYQIADRDVAAQLLAGLTALAFTDLRFRPAVQVSEEEIREYHAKLTDAASFDAVRDEIEALLTRERVEQALDQWLRDARASARIEYREQVFR